MSKINLPTAPRPAVIETPKRIILFSKPKTGKTIAVSKLPNCLILDCEEGTLAVEALSYPIKTVSDIDDVVEAIIESGKANGGKYPYNFIAVDTASALEELCLPEAELRYSRSAEGKTWFLREDGTTDPYSSVPLHTKSGKYQYGSILNLGFGKGQVYLSQVFNDIIVKLERVTPKLILLAHSTYATINKDGAEFSSLDIQMSKKCRFVATFKADAIGYIYRKGKQNFINFTATEDVGAGGRFRYLEKEHILISEYVEDGNGGEELKTYWESIFKPKAK